MLDEEIEYLRQNTDRFGGVSHFYRINNRLVEIKPAALVRKDNTVRDFGYIGNWENRQLVFRGEEKLSSGSTMALGFLQSFPRLVRGFVFVDGSLNDEARVIYALREVDRYLTESNFFSGIEEGYTPGNENI